MGCFTTILRPVTETSYIRIKGKSQSISRLYLPSRVIWVSYTNSYLMSHQRLFSFFIYFTIQKKETSKRIIFSLFIVFVFNFYLYRKFNLIKRNTKMYLIWFSYNNVFTSFKSMQLFNNTRVQSTFHPTIPCCLYSLDYTWHQDILYPNTIPFQT